MPKSPANRWGFIILAYFCISLGDYYIYNRIRDIVLGSIGLSGINDIICLFIVIKCHKSLGFILLGLSREIQEQSKYFS